MSLNKSGVKKGNSGPQDPRMLGITDKAIPTNQSGNNIVKETILIILFTCYFGHMEASTQSLNALSPISNRIQQEGL